MTRIFRLVLLIALLGVTLVPQATAASRSPLWIRHMQNYPGGISNGVRARLTAPHVDTREAALATVGALPSSEDLDNVQANTDCDPPLPQNETAVAFNPNNPMNAVAAANDYCGDGYWMGATFDGGQSWASIFKDPKSSSGDRCFGSDPTVVYSLRDSAFYVGTLCFFGTGISEVQVWKSVDGGLSWTDSTTAAIVITNQENGSIDPTLFYDKELVALDNNPSSPQYGRLYVTFIKFHMTLPSGRSDYCPAQVAYTDDIPTPDPSTAIWSHTAIVPNDPSARGMGPSANQWAIPVVDDTGALDVGYAIEECNTAYDPAMFFTRSVDGGASFSNPVQIDKPGQFADNPNREDQLPAKNARLPISPSLAFDASRGRLLWAYQNNLQRGVSGADISLQTSDDFGATWSDAQTISLQNGAAAPGDQFFPWLSLDESG